MTQPTAQNPIPHAARLDGKRRTPRTPRQPLWRGHRRRTLRPAKPPDARLASLSQRGRSAGQSRGAEARRCQSAKKRQGLALLACCLSSSRAPPWVPRDRSKSGGRQGTAHLARPCSWPPRPPRLSAHPKQSISQLGGPPRCLRWPDGPPVMVPLPPSRSCPPPRRNPKGRWTPSASELPSYGIIIVARLARISTSPPCD